MEDAKQAVATAGNAMLAVERGTDKAAEKKNTQQRKEDEWEVEGWGWGIGFFFTCDD